jgi:hypothetical protein
VSASRGTICRYPTVSLEAVLDVEVVFMDEFKMLIHGAKMPRAALCALVLGISGNANHADEQVLVFKMLAFVVAVRGGPSSTLVPILCRSLSLLEVRTAVHCGFQDRKSSLSHG